MASGKRICTSVENFTQHTLLYYYIILFIIWYDWRHHVAPLQLIHQIHIIVVIMVSWNVCHANWDPYSPFFSTHSQDIPLLSFVLLISYYNIILLMRKKVELGLLSEISCTKEMANEKWQIQLRHPYHHWCNMLGDTSILCYKLIYCVKKLWKLLLLI